MGFGRTVASRRASRSVHRHAFRALSAAALLPVLLRGARRSGGQLATSG